MAKIGYWKLPETVDVRMCSHDPDQLPETVDVRMCSHDPDHSSLTSLKWEGPGGEKIKET